jgi:phytoene/squalene synthetase
MTMDLDRRTHDRESFIAYVHGSAEVVGLMCLRVFCDGDADRYGRLAPAAERLGAAFQKVNFLRDLDDDRINLGRRYFPLMSNTNTGSHVNEKAAIEAEIEADLDAAYRGLRQLPKGSRLGVYVAYRFYRTLLFKISHRSSEGPWPERVRVPNRVKLALLMKGVVRHNLGLL